MTDDTLGRAWPEQARYAAALVRQGELVSAIDVLVAAWRHHRYPELATFIDQLTRKLPQVAIKAKTAPKLQELWLETAAHGPSAVLPALLSGLAEGTPEHVGQRIEALAKRPDDPRISLALAELTAPVRTISSGPMRTVAKRFPRLKHLDVT